jgi:hypothetical protein
MPTLTAGLRASAPTWTRTSFGAPRRGSSHSSIRAQPVKNATGMLPTVALEVSRPATAMSTATARRAAYEPCACQKHSGAVAFVGSDGPQQPPAPHR